LSSGSGCELILHTFDAAKWSTSELKLRALGRTLAACANDGSMIDYELLLVAAIHAIEGSHVRVLQVIKDNHSGRQRRSHGLVECRGARGGRPRLHPRCRERADRDARSPRTARDQFGLRGRADMENYRVGSTTPRSSGG
jgi:hypothetical protein